MSLGRFFLFAPSPSPAPILRKSFQPLLHCRPLIFVAGVRVQWLDEFNFVGKADKRRGSSRKLEGAISP